MGEPVGTERVTGERVEAEGRYIAFKRLEWVDHAGTPRTWEVADRVGFAGAVLIIPRLSPSGRILVIRQFRPPARRYVYEFPAGLMDAGESPEAAARRELREETGYAAARLRVWPAAYTTPGLSNECVYIVEADIDENAPENAKPKTDFDSTEMIASLLVPESELGGFYRRAVERGEAFDAKLAAYIIMRQG